MVKIVCAECLKAARKGKKHPNKNCGCPCQHKRYKDKADYLVDPPPVVRVCRVCKVPEGTKRLGHKMSCPVSKWASAPVWKTRG